MGLAGAAGGRHWVAQGMSRVQRTGSAVLPGAAKYRPRLSKHRDTEGSAFSRVAHGALDLDALDLDQPRQAVFQNPARHRRRLIQLRV